MKIVNFSSPHPFTLTTGEVIPAVDAETARRLSLDAVEVEVPHPALPGVTDVKVSFRMTPQVAERLAVLEADPTVDVVLVPFPVMTALKEANMPIGKARVCRLADRVTKVVHADRFCC